MDAGIENSVRSTTLPRKTLGDRLHFAGRLGLSSIPFFGGAAVEVFNEIIAPPLETRKDAFLSELLNRLESLEAKGAFTVEDLQSNEQFISTVFQATSIAIRNHQKEKLAALRNAIVKSALGQLQDESKRQLFLTFIDAFSASHLRVLQRFHELDDRIPRRVRNNVREITIAATENMPEFREQQDFVTVIVDDLCRKGLLTWNRDGGAAYISEKMRQVAPLGEEFLTFISESHSEG